MADQEELIHQINSLSDSIRKKHLILKSGISEKNAFIENTFKPIVEPLKDISQQLKHTKEFDTMQADSTVKHSTPASSSKKILSQLDLSSTDDNVESDNSEVSETLEPTTQSGKGETDLPTKSTDTAVSNLSIIGQSIGEKSDTARKYLVKMLHDNPGHNRNYHVYGARIGDDGLMVGDSELQIDKSDNFIINGKVYKGTPGLYELLFKNIPNGYTKRDLNKFKKICIQTNLHRRRYSKTSPIHRNNSKKYNLIISTLFPTVRGKVTGSGMSLKSLNQTNVFYYHDLNDLVDRMRLIHDAKQAGHTGLDNEMLALIEELKRKNIVV